MNRYASMAIAGMLIASVAGLSGCRRQRDAEVQPPAARSPNDQETSGNATGGGQSADSEPAQVYEIDADALLAARLTEEESSDGWIRLFDGQTLYGWEMAGEANWRVEAGAIVVDQGAPSLLCTSMPWQDYQLQLEYKADRETNSGVFLRTILEPSGPEDHCYEVNIAPPDNPFPTGSVVKRKPAQQAAPEAPSDQWRTMEIHLEGGRLQVSLDGQQLTEFEDSSPLSAARIGLQHNEGRIAFRNVRLRPLGMNSLLGEDLSQWKKYPEMPGDFSLTEDGWLHVQGGRTQLESQQQYGDFVLLATYKLPTEEMNSGIFFRCIPGDEMMGYECQISNAMKQNNPLLPADHGSGGIFRRQEARLVAGEVNKWATVLLNVHDRRMAAWVNGIQVSDWEDDREPDPNPRRGRRTDAGTLMIQGHDPGTDALFKQIKVREFSSADSQDRAE